MLRPEVARSISAIKAEARRRGIPFRVTSTFRSSTSQERLYRAWLARGRTGLPAARPGLSTHEYGIAFDAVFPPSRQAEVVDIASRNGMVWFGQADAVHFDVFGPSAWNALLRRVGAI